MKKTFDNSILANEDKAGKKYVYVYAYNGVYRVDGNVVVGPGSTDSQFTGQMPVSAVQAGLNVSKIVTDLSYADLTVDGIYGEMTASAVRAFQTYARNHGYSNIVSDGWVGPNTWPALEHYSKEGHDYR